MQQYQIVIRRIDNPNDVVTRGPYSKYAAKKQLALAEDRWGLVMYTIKMEPVPDETVNQ